MLNWLTYGLIDIATYTQSFLVLFAFLLWFLSVKRHIDIKENLKLLSKVAAFTLAGALVSPFFIQLLRGRMVQFFAGIGKAIVKIDSGHTLWLFLNAAYQGVSITAGFFLLVLAIRLMPSAKKLTFPLIHPFILFAAVARMGCFVKGCCFGKKIDPHSIFATIYPPNSPASAYFNKTEQLMSRFQPSLPVHPTQLYLVVALLLLFVLQHFLWKKKIVENYTIAIIAVAGYGIINFFIEFLRQEQLLYDFLTLGQFADIGLVLIAISMFFAKPVVEKPVEQTRGKA
ncbi:prolipoprotein diacylglyceryl transferase [bacterium]|nr:prolipoprotein diacylglyceryl transferase [bacterium]